MNVLTARLFLGFIVAFVLTIIPLPAFVNEVRPAFVLLMVLFVQCFSPTNFRVSLIFLLGLYLDAMCSTVMGEHAFALLVTTWFVSGRIRRFSYYSVIHQMSIIGLTSFIYQTVLYVIDAFLGHTAHIFQLIGIPFTNALVWPCLTVLFSVESSKSSLWSRYEL